MGQSCPNQVWAKLSTGVHQRPEISISKLHFDNPFQGYPTCPPFMSPDTEHLAPENPGARCRHLAHHLNLASGVSLKRAFKMQFRNAYFRSLVHPSQKLGPKPD